MILAAPSEPHLFILFIKSILLIICYVSVIILGSTSTGFRGSGAWEGAGCHIINDGLNKPYWESYICEDGEWFRWVYIWGKSAPRQRVRLIQRPWGGRLPRGNVAGAEWAKGSRECQGLIMWGFLCLWRTFAFILSEWLGSRCRVLSRHMR